MRKQLGYSSSWCKPLSTKAERRRTRTTERRGKMSVLSHLTSFMLATHSSCCCCFFSKSARQAGSRSQKKHNLSGREDRRRAMRHETSLQKGGCLLACFGLRACPVLVRMDDASNPSSPSVSERARPVCCEGRRRAPWLSRAPGPAFLRSPKSRGFSSTSSRSSLQSPSLPQSLITRLRKPLSKEGRPLQYPTRT